MSRHRFDRIARWGFTVVLATMLGWAHAAELGEPVVTSYRGQPLVADIELTALADPNVAVVVRLAHADVYRGANISRHPVLTNLNMSVMRRDGRQFLHITSTRPVDSDYVNLFLELNDGGRREVRSAILWLTADPAPVAPLVPVARAAPATDSELEAAVARAAMLARERQELRARQQAPAAACPQQLSSEQAKTCAAIDYKNGLLSAQIVELEEKVKLLQAAIEGKKPPAAARPPAKPAVPPPAKPAPPKKSPGTDWLLTGALVGGVLALIGGLVFFLRRRKKGKTAEEAASASAAWYARLLARFKRKPKSEEHVHVEPKVE